MAIFLGTRSSGKIKNMMDILNSYGILCDNISLNESDNVDTYDLKLSMGSRVSKVNRVLVDVGMQLGSHTTPSGVPLTGKGVFRVSVQNKAIESSPINVGLLELQSSDGLLCPVLIGRDIDSNNLIIDLNKVPNVIIGGIPGSGKSMLLHSIILSSIKNGSDVYLCDPKMVEFSCYKDIRSVKSICYDFEDFDNIINELIFIMNKRFSVLSKKSFRNIVDYNNNLPTRLGLLSNKRMSPIVVVVDEWADIYLQDKRIESKLCILAQKGRAAGISIVLATQRPSAKIISGLIKASFPGRIAMRTASAVDSRVIIDQGGAERLIDPGAGLYKDAYTFSPTVFRAPYIGKDMLENPMGVL